MNKIVIVGGGTAGWMTATTLATFYPEKDITVIESPDYPTVGVGESTLGQLRRWTHTVGLDEKDFMRKCDASYKLSIKFTDFYDKGAGSFPTRIVPMRVLVPDSGADARFRIGYFHPPFLYREYLMKAETRYEHQSREPFEKYRANRTARSGSRRSGSHCEADLRA